jgi:hypothetical protein
MSDGWEVNANDRATARSGVEIQFSARGFDLTDPKVKSLVDNQVEVIASWAAQCRWQQTHIHNLSNLGDRGPQDGQS